MGARLISLPTFRRSLKAGASFALHWATGLRLAKILSPASSAVFRAIVSGIVVNVTNIPVNVLHDGTIIRSPE
jgi:hypothetical protein